MSFQRLNVQKPARQGHYWHFQWPQRCLALCWDSSAGPLISSCQIFHRSFTDLFCNSHSKTTAVLKVFLSVCPSPSGSLGLRYHVKTRERRGSSFSQLGLEPNHTGLTAQSLFFLEESCRVKRSDTQTSSNFSNYFKRVLKLQKRSSSFSK